MMRSKFDDYEQAREGSNNGSHGNNLRLSTSVRTEVWLNIDAYGYDTYRTIYK
jgi:hypothetical protein